MTFTLIDIVLAVMVLAFVLFGFFYGFVHTLGTFLGAIIAFVLSGYLLPFVGTVIPLGPVSSVIIFLILFGIILRLVGLLYLLVENTIGLIARLPLLNFIDGLLGGALGLVEGMVVAGVLIHVSVTYLGPGPFVNAINASSVAGVISGLTTIVIAWLPF